MRRRLALFIIGGLALASIPLAGSAFADGDATCPKVAGDCIIQVEKPGGGGSGGSGDDDGGGGQYIPGLGWKGSDGCYYDLADPQPPYSSEIWPTNPDGSPRTDGTFYAKTCMGNDGGVGWSITTLIWLADPPAGPSPDEVAREILPIRGPDIHLSVESDGTGTVGLPVWLWTPATESTWGPMTRSARVTGVEVTATARASRIVWDLGDGHQVTCDSPGTPYAPSYGRKPSPDCGHTYVDPSRSWPGGRHPITATTTWNVTWSSGGASGSFTVTRTSSSSVRINEAVVVVE